MSRWALFLSGKGSTAQSVMDLLGDVDVRVVVSSRKKAPGLCRARRMGLPTVILDKTPNWIELSCQLRERGVEKILLTGFMKMLPPDFLQEWQGQIWNVHPSLLPAYPGLNAMRLSFDEGSKMGVTVHEVSEEMDAGRPILRASLPNSGRWDEMQLSMARLEQRLLRELVYRLSFCEEAVC